MAKTFSKEDVAKNNKPDSLWIIVDEDVYDLTKFQNEHPGAFLKRGILVAFFVLACDTDVCSANRWKEEYVPSLNPKQRSLGPQPEY